MTLAEELRSRNFSEWCETSWRRSSADALRAAGIYGQWSVTPLSLSVFSTNRKVAIIDSTKFLEEGGYTSLAVEHAEPQRCYSASKLRNQE